MIQGEPWVLPIDCGKQNYSALDDGWLFNRLCQPNDTIGAELNSRGFSFAAHVNDLWLLLGSSARLLATTASLETAVERAVREIVLLEAPPGYDISHSEPNWPETIFVSVPTDADQVSALRTLENIVHEAMHLQLTKLEGLTPLISDFVSQMSSPWRKEPRHLQGVLHGAYVFNCIGTFFGRVSLRESLDTPGIEYVTRRRLEITSELQQVNFKRLAAGLTHQGTKFMNTLLHDDALH